MESRESYHISLKIFINNSSNETLILTAVNNGTFAGYHDLPGGRIDKHEFSVPLLSILQREIEEEVGLTGIVINPKPVAVGRHLILSKFTIEKSRDIPVFYVFYEGTLSSGDVKISDEHGGYKWVDLSKIDLEKYFTSGILEGVRMYLQSK